MSDELRRALDDLVQGVAAEQDARARAGGGLPISRMTARARRGRVRRAALVSAITACAVLGAAAGGVAVATWDRPSPAPAGPPTRTAVPTPRPTPAPTTDAPTAPRTVLPTGDGSLPFGACGSLVASPTDPPAAPEVVLRLTTAPAAVPRGATVEVRTTLGSSGDIGVVGTGSGPRIVVARDGVVVAVADTYPAAARVDTVNFVYDDPQYPSSAIFVSHITPTVCDAPGAVAGAALPAGDYEVLALSEAWTTPRDELMGLVGDSGWTVQDVAEHLPLEHRSAVSDPVTLRIEPRDVDPATLPPVPTGPPSLEGAGSYSDAYSYPDPCTQAVTPNASEGVLTVAGPAGTVTAGDDVEIRTTYAGSGRLTLRRASDLRLVRDGEVVATTVVTFGREDIDHGTTVTAVAPTSVGRSCSDGATAEMDVPVPPGTYTAYPVTVVSPEGLVAPDGTDVLPRGWEGAAHELVGEPFTLVVP